MSLDSTEPVEQTAFVAGTTYRRAVVCTAYSTRLDLGGGSSGLAPTFTRIFSKKN